MGLLFREREPIVIKSGSYTSNFVGDLRVRYLVRVQWEDVKIFSKLYNDDNT